MADISKIKLPDNITYNLRDSRVPSKEDTSNKVNTLSGNESSTTKYPSAKAVADAIGAINQFKYEIYASTSAVTSPKSNVLYLIGPTGSGSDKYEEYVYSNNAWIKIGDTSIDLSGRIASGIPFAKVDSTSTSTAFTATVPEITELKDGVCVLLKNGVVTSASGFTININGLGAHHAFSNLTAATADTTIFNVDYTMLFVYDSTRVVGGITGAWCCYRGYDSNTDTIGYQLRTNHSSLPVSGATGRYRLLFTSPDGTHFVPPTTSTSTDATSTRVVNQEKIDPFGRIVLYNYTTNLSANSRPGVTYLYDQVALTLGYSFNRTGAALTLTPWTPVYVKCAPQTDGSAIIDADTPYVQALPTSEDGKIYIFLGVAYSATAIELMPNHPVYCYKDGAVRQWGSSSGNELPVLYLGSGATDEQKAHNLEVLSQLIPSSGFVFNKDVTFIFTGGFFSGVSFNGNILVGIVQDSAYCIRVHVLGSMVFSDMDYIESLITTDGELTSTTNLGQKLDNIYGRRIPAPVLSIDPNTDTIQSYTVGTNGGKNYIDYGDYLDGDQNIPYVINADDASSGGSFICYGMNSYSNTSGSGYYFYYDTPDKTIKVTVDSNGTITSSWVPRHHDVLDDLTDAEYNDIMLVMPTEIGYDRVSNDVLGDNHHYREHTDTWSDLELSGRDLQEYADNAYTGLDYCDKLIDSGSTFTYNNITYNIYESMNDSGAWPVLLNPAVHNLNELTSLSVHGGGDGVVSGLIRLLNDNSIGGYNLAASDEAHRILYVK